MAPNLNARSSRRSVIAGAAWSLLLIPGLALCQGGAAAAKVEQEAAPKPSVLWEFDAGEYEFSEVIAGFGMVFALDRKGKIHALDGAEGDLLWSTEGKLGLSYSFGHTISTMPGLTAVVVSCDEGLLALDPKSGGVLWRTEVPLGLAAPVCAEKTIVAASGNGHVYGFDPATGKVLWKHGYMDDAPEDPEGFEGDRARFGGRPARPNGASTDGKLAFVSIFDQCRTIAVDALTGKRVWSYQAQGWLSGAASVGKDHVFIGSQDKHLHAVDRLTGELRWKVKTGSRVPAGGTQAGGTVYFGSCDARLYAVDAATGDVKWKFETEHDDGFGAPIYSSPLVVGNDVYLAAMRGKVYRVDAKTGDLRWKVEPVSSSEINSELVTDGERFFLTTRKEHSGGGMSTVIALSQ